MAATATVVVFLIHQLRNVIALRKLLGEKLKGILCSDHWRAYGHWPTDQRQVCWAFAMANSATVAEGIDAN